MALVGVRRCGSPYLVLFRSLCNCPVQPPPSAGSVRILVTLRPGAHSSLRVKHTGHFNDPARVDCQYGTSRARAAGFPRGQTRHRVWLVLTVMISHIGHISVSRPAPGYLRWGGGGRGSQWAWQSVPQCPSEASRWCAAAIGNHYLGRTAGGPAV